MNFNDPRSKSVSDIGLKYPHLHIPLSHIFKTLTIEGREEGRIWDRKNLTSSVLVNGNIYVYPLLYLVHYEDVRKTETKEGVSRLCNTPGDLCSRL